MEFKLPPIEVPKEDPFRFDGLNRREAVENLTSLVDALKGPFTLAIDSPWGTGKSTFIRMWKTFLESNGFLCIYFDAWNTDFSSDPLVAFLGELDGLAKKKGGKLTPSFEKAKRIATLLSKRVLPTAGKIATAGLLDLDQFTEKALADLAADNIKDAVDAYTAEKELITQFRQSLVSVIADLSSVGKKSQLVVFVDEIDRCKPTFAVELLERIKHLFNVENAIFILALDKSQLAVSLKAVYGEGLNVEEYLRRFVDLEYLLVRGSAEQYFKNIYGRFGFDAFFKARTHQELRYEREHLQKTVTALSSVYGLSLRAQEQCLTRIRVAMMTIPADHFFHPLLLATLVMIRAGAPDVYRRYSVEDGAASDVLNHIASLPGGMAFLDSHEGAVTEAYLIAAKRMRWSKDSSGEMQELERVLKDEKADRRKRERADTVLRVIENMDMRDRTPSLAYVVKKIELTAQFSQ